ncbi:unnamed protein product, partial [Mesorhabditis spiculigera]
MSVVMQFFYFFFSFFFVATFGLQCYEGGSAIVDGKKQETKNNVTCECGKFCAMYLIETDGVETDFWSCGCVNQQIGQVNLCTESGVNKMGKDPEFEVDCCSGDLCNGDIKHDKDDKAAGTNFFFFSTFFVLLSNFF